MNCKNVTGKGWTDLRSSIHEFAFEDLVESKQAILEADSRLIIVEIFFVKN